MEYQDILKSTKTATTTIKITQYFLTKKRASMPNVKFIFGILTYLSISKSFILTVCFSQKYLTKETDTLATYIF